MDIEPLVKRLEELSKVNEVDQYLFWRDMEMSDDLLFANDNTTEYEKIEFQLKNLLLEEINERSLPIFEGVDFRHFDLQSIEQQLGKFGHPHWQSRNDIEVKRDTLLRWQYHYYDYHYKRVDKFVHLQNIDKERKAYQQKMEEELTTQFLNTFIQNLLANRLQDQLRSLQGYYYDFISHKAKEIFEDRNEEIKERDSYAYLDLARYESCLKNALDQAIDVFQSSSKEETVEQYLIFIRDKIAQNNSEEYLGTVDNDLYDYAYILFENRTASKIEDDNFKLIDFDTYLKWRYRAIELLENEFPSLFTDDDFEDFDDYDDHQIDRSGYEKYGGYNGYDDDTIDDAFEGDPSNTWNVD